MMKEKAAYFHLPGLFEHEEFYRIFLSFYRDHRDYFYPWVRLASLYGAPLDCLWGGGRLGGDASKEEAIFICQEFHLSARLTLSNSLLKEEHLSDKKCNALCDRFLKEGNGAIVASELLLQYLRTKYPKAYFVSSTTKSITDFSLFQKELDREEFAYVVPDFRLNKRFTELSALNSKEKDKIEFLVNEACDVRCLKRKECYESVSYLNLGIEKDDWICPFPEAKEGYSFERAKMNPSFIGIDDIVNHYLPMGFSQFKIEGRNLDEESLLEILLYYLIKPEYQKCVQSSFVFL